MHIEPEASPFDRILWIALAAGALGVAFGGCAAQTVRPDERSAESHRREAAQERLIANAESAQYDPNVRVRSHAQADGTPVVSDYNPTERHLRAAADHKMHAKEHEAAAAELERFEDAACAGVAATVRAACPVFGPVLTIADIGGGVRVEPSDATRLPEVLARMRCHLAFARTRGFAAAPDCPLYMKGVEIRAAADGRAIELTAPDAKTIEELRRRVRAEASAATVL